MKHLIRQIAQDNLWSKWVAANSDAGCISRPAATAKAGCISKRGCISRKGPGLKAGCISRRGCIS